MNIEKQIEFDKIKALWADLAITDGAKETIKEASLLFSENTLRKQLKDTTKARLLLEKLGTPPLQNITEIKEVLTAAEKGDCLTPYQLERIASVLAAIKRLKDYLERGKMLSVSLAFYEENLDALPELAQEIGNTIHNGTVADHASKELAQLRKQILRCEEQMKQKAEQLLRSNKAYMTDQYCTFRNGRICLPVKKEYKLKISGSVIDHSATGSTLFMEPTVVAKYYEELQLLMIGEENEIYRILYALSAFVSDNAPVLKADLYMIEKLDFIFSKGKLSMDMDAVEPTIHTKRSIQLTDARHPLMDKNTAVPLQFAVGETDGKTDDNASNNTNNNANSNTIGNIVRGIVITGPNTGGKTVAIKTVMLNCIMAQCGLHVTCRQAALCMHNAYLCDIGDGQNLSENLSTFSAHITNVLEVLKEADEESFVIMDELGSGTDPAEGMGIAIAILEELRKSGAIFLVTTHYPEIKEYAAKADDIINARMTFDKETLRPTYQMVIGQAGESCAFYIADRLGMPNEMLRTAIRAAYGEEAVNSYSFQKPDSHLARTGTAKLTKTSHSKIKSAKTTADLSNKYKIGDSVMVYPDQKIGIVCAPVNEKGVLRVQLPNKKIWINHKRVKLHVAATELYPEDYDFSIVFESVENRKKRHDMQRKYTEDIIEAEE